MCECVCVFVCALKRMKTDAFFHSLSVYRKVYYNYYTHIYAQSKKEDAENKGTAPQKNLMKCECKKPTQHMRARGSESAARIPEPERRGKTSEKNEVFFLLRYF